MVNRQESCRAPHRDPTVSPTCLPSPFCFPLTFPFFFLLYFSLGSRSYLGLRRGWESRWEKWWESWEDMKKWASLHLRSFKTKMCIARLSTKVLKQATLPKTSQVSDEQSEELVLIGQGIFLQGQYYRSQVSCCRNSVVICWIQQWGCFFLIIAIWECVLSVFCGFCPSIVLIPFLRLLWFLSFLQIRKPNHRETEWLAQGKWDRKLQIWNWTRDSSLPKAPGDFF